MTTAKKSVAERMLATHPSSSFAKTVAWQAFLNRVVDLLTQTEARLRDATVWRGFAERDGWWLQAMRKSASGTKVKLPSEDAITDAIEEIARDILRVTRPADPFTDHLELDAQVNRPPHHRIGRKALTTDIRVRSTLVEDLEVRIEAKLLFKPSDVRSAYLGEKGLLRFADPRAPYTDRPVGFMLAYSLQDHDPDWNALIRSGLSGMSQVIATDEVVIGSGSHVVSDLTWGSEERQKVTVVHLNMTYETDPSCRADDI